MKLSFKLKGFTLIELIVVIGIIAILAAIVIIAVNPGRQFRQARDSQRRNDTLAILDAVHQYSADNNGILPAVIPTTAANVCDGKTLGSACTGGTIDLGANGSDVLVPNYLTSLPKDPGGPGLTAGTPANTQYTIVKDANNRVTVCAPSTEVASPDICITR